MQIFLEFVEGERRGRGASSDGAVAEGWMRSAVGGLLVLLAELEGGRGYDDFCSLCAQREGSRHHPEIATNQI